jgi:negative regulator of flagellin synthesis FlgM
MRRSFMEIRGIDGVRGIDNNSKVNKVAKKGDDITTSNDSAVISTEAKQMAEEAKLRSIIDKSPDVRADKIEQVKERMSNGSYDNEEVLKTVAERLMKVLGL